MRKGSPIKLAAGTLLLVSAPFGVLGCKDTEALAQIKKLKAELEERDDDLASADQRVKAAQKEAADAAKEAADARAENTTAKKSLDELKERETLLLQELAACTSPGGVPVPVPSSLGRQCTAYFKFMEDCLPKMPTAMQSALQESLDTMKRTLGSSGTLGLSAMEQGCEAALDAMSKIPQCRGVPKPCTCDPADPLCPCTP